MPVEGRTGCSRQGGKLRHGEGYKYAHDFPEGHVQQDYLGVNKTYYEPTDRGYEAEIAERMNRLRAKSDSADANRRVVQFFSTQQVLIFLTTRSLAWYVENEMCRNAYI